MLLAKSSRHRAANAFLFMGAAVVLWFATAESRLSAQTTSCASPTAGNPCVLTSQYDNARDAWNYNETTLTPSNVSGLSVASFSPLAVDTNDLPSTAPSNPIYAQPLYVAGIQTSLSNCTPTCNMLLAATLNGTVFAFNTSNGSTVWSRRGKTGTAGTNALWYDDCKAESGPGPGGTALPFVGIVATPVIDYTLSTPTMFLTSMCQDQFQNQHWYLHGLSLQTGADISSSPVEITGSVSGSNNADDLTDGEIPFEPQRQHQRAGLLEAPVPAISGVSPLIYIAFGVGIAETTTAYHGWVFGYNTSLSQQFAFATTNNGYNTSGSPPCCTSCTPCSSQAGCCTGTGCTLGTQCCPTNCVPQNGSGTYFQNSPNWCGHGGGIWMSGRAPAAQNDPSSVSHAFFASGNGGFQQNNGDWSESVLHFALSSTSMETSPSRSFTPYGGVGMSPPTAGSVCPNETGGACVSTAEILNENDWDFGVSGVTLFTDSEGESWLVTTDKAGYGYLLRQNQSWGYAFGSGDSYNWFPFGAAQNLCPYMEDPIAGNCDRIVSLAFFNPSGGTPYLYFYPWNESLAGYQFSTNSAQSLSGYTVTTSGNTVTTASGATHFTEWLVPGDQITVSTTPTATVLTVTAVNSDASLTVYQTSSISSPTALASYNGYFINPIYDSHPLPTTVGYPGGLLAGTSNGNSASSALLWTLVTESSSGRSNEAVRTPGILYAYNSSLSGLWNTNSSSSFCASSLVLPMVVHGQVFIPTYATSSPCPTSGSAAASGIIVYH